MTGSEKAQAVDGILKERGIPYFVDDGQGGGTAFVHHGKTDAIDFQIEVHPDGSILVFSKSMKPDAAVRAALGM